MKTRLRPKIISPQIDDIVDYYDALKVTIPLEDDFLSIDSDFKKFLNTGVADSSVTSFMQYQPSRFQPSSQMLGMMRYKYIQEYGFCLLSEGLINELAIQLKDEHVVEVGAGTGFLASCLQEKGINITPVDYKEVVQNEYGFKNNFTQITIGDAKEFLEKNSQPFTNVIMSWPHYSDDFASSILSHLKQGQRLYYCGEGYGGCTGDDFFFELLETKAVMNERLTLSLRSHELAWHGVHDSWYVYDNAHD